MSLRRCDSVFPPLQDVTVLPEKRQDDGEDGFDDHRLVKHEKPVAVG